MSGALSKIIVSLSCQQQKRDLYDQFGEKGLSENGGMGGGMDPSDLFSQLFGGGGGGFFGGGGGGGRQGPRKGKDLVHRIKVSLEDLYRGKVTKLALQKSILCSKCNGKGGKDGAEPRPCMGCHGRGVKLTLRSLGPMVQQIQQVCNDCNGEGEVINPRDRCRSCNGKKTTNERKVLEVHIDKGMKEGQTITFTGEADQAPGIIPGDVVIVVEEKPHDRFKRKGDDLFMEQNIDLLTALAGGSFVVDHFDDRAIRVQILPGEIIRPGSIKAVKQGGMPSFRHHELGDLYIHLNVIFPDSLPETSFPLLENALPTRPTVPEPSASLIEEAVLADVDEASARRREADDAMDEDDEAQPRVQCANQCASDDSQSYSAFFLTLYRDALRNMSLCFVITCYLGRNATFEPRPLRIPYTQCVSPLPPSPFFPLHYLFRLSPFLHPFASRLFSSLRPSFSAALSSPSPVLCIVNPERGKGAISWLFFNRCSYTRCSILEIFRLVAQNASVH
jgi:DnaJ family protein A protein 2